MALTAAEQYLLELINRARLDPTGEAARYGIDLNAGLATGTITTASKQVLSPDVLLENAASAHSKWMIDADVFSHTGSGGSSFSQRATNAGYRWSNVAENLGWQGTSGTMNLNRIIDTHHKELFLSAGHRQNLMNDVYQQVGIGQEGGLFNYNGRNYDSSMVTELFGKPATAAVFLTGVIYNDTDKNGFYSIGEAVAGATISTLGTTMTSAAAGGYGMSIQRDTGFMVSGQVGALNYQFALAGTRSNVKVDIVDQKLLLTSDSVALKLGLNWVTLLGTADLTAGGNEANNVMRGNSGANRLNGAAGNDMLFGNAGNDTILGGNGGDRIDGGAGNDVLSGNLGADTFVFANEFGRDTITDFSLAAGEKLVFDDLIWGGSAFSAQQVVTQFAHVVAGNVVFEFGANEIVTLSGITSTAGLANTLMIV